MKTGVTLCTGDIFASGCEALVDPCNALGVHGKGLAAEFKKRWPAAIHDFTREAKRGAISPGAVVAGYTGHMQPRYVFCFATKDHWRDPSRMPWIEEGLRQLVEMVRAMRVRSLAIPALGCGLGGLDWERVRPLIENAGRQMTGAQVQIYGPEDVKQANVPRDT